MSVVVTGVCMRDMSYRGSPTRIIFIRQNKKLQCWDLFSGFFCKLAYDNIIKYPYLHQLYMLSELSTIDTQLFVPFSQLICSGAFKSVNIIREMGNTDDVELENDEQLIEYSPITDPIEDTCTRHFNPPMHDDNYQVTPQTFIKVHGWMITYESNGDEGGDFSEMCKTDMIVVGIENNKLGNNTRFCVYDNIGEGSGDWNEDYTSTLARLIQPDKFIGLVHENPCIVDVSTAIAIHLARVERDMDRIRDAVVTWNKLTSQNTAAKILLSKISINGFKLVQDLIDKIIPDDEVELQKIESEVGDLL